MFDDFTFDGNWAPRLGITFDPTGAGRMKLFANYGRFFAKVPNDLAARALSADAGISRADYFDANLTQPIPDGVLAGRNDATPDLRRTVAVRPSIPNAKSTYRDET